MGLPYSRQINEAFDQVTPLVAQGFQVLETTKDIAILLAWIQVLTVALLALILSALIALLVSVNPDLEKDRQAFVTPIVRTLMHRGAFVVWAGGGAALFMAMIAGLYFAIHGGSKMAEEAEHDETEQENEAEKSNVRAES